MEGVYAPRDEHGELWNGAAARTGNPVRYLMAPSSYGAALWQKVFGGTLFGGLSLMAAFLLRVGENRVESKLDPKVFTLLMGVFFITATMAVLANFAADLLYSALDPRIRVGSGA